MYQNLNTGEFVSVPPELLDEYCKLLSKYRDDPEVFAALVARFRNTNVGVCVPSEGPVIVYTLDDERAQAILNADMDQLPEFLANDDLGVRLMAKYRFEVLTGSSE